MATQYILRRIIPQNECPGTCCQKTGLVSDGDGACIYWLSKIDGRKFGGCQFFNLDNSINESKLSLSVLSNEDKIKFSGIHCNGYPVPDLIPAFDTPYPTNFGREFGEVCPCFEWEVIQD